MIRLLSVIFTLGLLLMIICPSSSLAQEHKGQMVTWGDFNLVRYVAGSMSHVYFLTTSGITRYNKMERRWEDPLTGSPGIDHFDISRIWVDIFDEKLYARTTGGLYEYNLFFEAWYPVNELPSIENDARHVDRLPLMYPPFGYNYDPDGRLIDPFGNYFGVTDVIDDGSGNYWIGTWGYGAATASIGSNVIELLPYGILQNRVNALAFEDDHLWIGGEIFDSHRSGLTLFDLDNNEFEYVESGLENQFPAHDVSCLIVSEDQLLVGTSYGLTVLDLKTHQPDRHIKSRHGLSGDSISCLALMGDTIIVGTSLGLNLIAPDSDSLLIIQIGHFDNFRINDLEIMDSSIWIASEIGIHRLFLPSGRLQTASIPELTSGGEAMRMDRWEDDLWFATRGGLVRLNTKTGDVEPILNSGYGVEEIQALVANEWVVLVGTWRGLTLVDYGEDRLSTRQFTTDDGLPSNNIRKLLLDGDYVWVGSDRGLTRFWWNNPSRID